MQPTIRYNQFVNAYFTVSFCVFCVNSEVEKNEEYRQASEYAKDLMAKVKTYIAQTMRVEKISIFQIDENLNAFSQAIYLCPGTQL